MQRVLMRFVRAATHRLVTRRRQRSARRRARWLRRHHQHQCRSRRRKRGTSACSPSRAGRLRGSARASPRRASAAACRENPRACARPLRAGGRFCSLHDPAVFTGTQCIALKRDGTRCRVFSGAAHEHAQPLRDGLHVCDHHKRWPIVADAGLPTAADCSDAAA